MIKVGEWRRATDRLPPEMPVIFRADKPLPLKEGDYCDGEAVEVSRYWESGVGWRPCVTVSLTEEI